MRNYLTPNDIANNVRMLRSLHSGAILIVEGDKDRRVYERFIDKGCCKLVYAFGKRNAVGAITILEKANFQGSLAIVDSDFFKLDGIKPKTPNIVLTDTHDLETMLFSSGALEKILSEFGSEPKIEKLKRPMREYLLERALPIGLLRWISAKDNMWLNFKDLSFKKFLNESTLNLNVDIMINEVISNTKKCLLDKNSIKTKVMKLKVEGYDPWHVCSGHDLIEILSFGLRKNFGNNKTKKISTEILDSILRIAYDYSYFGMTELYNSIKKWERRNPPFKILER